jgi:hypothetical protein
MLGSLALNPTYKSKNKIYLYTWPIRLGQGYDGQASGHGTQFFLDITADPLTKKRHISLLAATVIRF